MVYAVPSNRPIVSKTPLKTTRVQGEHSKSMEEFMRTHRVSVTENDKGEPVVITKKYDAV